MSGKFQFSGRVSLLHLNARKEGPDDVAMSSNGSRDVLPACKAAAA